MDGAGGYSGTGDERAGGAQRNPQNQADQECLQQALEKVDEVFDVMCDNVEKILERDEKLSELDKRADNLQQWASQFEQGAGKLNRKYCWKNHKLMIIVGIIALLIIVILIVWASLA
jgi:vesicle-associated membrane protein 2